MNYGDLASYFAQSGSTRSTGRAGGPGYRNDFAISGQGVAQNPAASAGAGGWAVSAALDTSDKSSFGSTFSQQFGGITNNQIIDSPNASGASTYSPAGGAPYAPIANGGGSVAGLPGGNSTVLIAVAILAAALILRR